MTIEEKESQATGKQGPGREELGDRPAPPALMITIEHYGNDSDNDYGNYDSDAKISDSGKRK